MNMITVIWSLKWWTMTGPLIFMCFIKCTGPILEGIVYINNFFFSLKQLGESGKWWITELSSMGSASDIDNTSFKLLPTSYSAGILTFINKLKLTFIKDEVLEKYRHICIWNSTYSRVAEFDCRHVTVQVQRKTQDEMPCRWQAPEGIRLSLCLVSVYVRTVYCLKSRQSSALSGLSLNIYRFFWVEILRTDPLLVVSDTHLIWQCIQLHENFPNWSSVPVSHW